MITELLQTETNDWLNNNALYPYQEQLWKLCEERADPDHIHWVIDANGGKGKTTFKRLFYLTHLDTTTVLSSTSKKDALHASSKKVVIVDLSMSTNMAMLDYSCLENLKTHTSAKFDGHTPMGNPPAVMLILSNNEPRLLQAPSLKMQEYSSRKGATFDHVNL